jgi:NADPH:quinone reductase-like Zn-dependent oxidoreductase
VANRSAQVLFAVAALIAAVLALAIPCLPFRSSEESALVRLGVFFVLIEATAPAAMVTQLAREAGAHVIGTGRAADRQTSLDFGAQEFVDLDNDVLEDIGEVDLVFDVIGGDIGKRSAPADCERTSATSRPSTMPSPP